MIGRRGTLSLLASIGLSLVVASCNPVESSASYRFRMSVEGVRQGSAVYEIVATKDRVIMASEQKPGGSLLRGDALPLEGSDGPVFLLLERPDARLSLIDAVTRALAPDISEGGHEGFWKAVNRLGGRFGSASAELPRADWPLMVRFRDLDDPASVERVEPESVGIRRIMLKTTRDEVTTGIRSKLPWLSDGGLTLDPRASPTIDPTFAQTIRQRAFTTEIRR